MEEKYQKYTLEKYVNQVLQTDKQIRVIREFFGSDYQGGIDIKAINKTIKEKKFQFHIIELMDLTSIYWVILREPIK